MNTKTTEWKMVRPTLEMISAGINAQVATPSKDKLATLEADLAAANERIEELSFDAAMANQAREIGNHFGLTYMQVWSDTSIASQVIDKMKEQQATIAQQAEQLAAAQKDAERYRWALIESPKWTFAICKREGTNWVPTISSEAIDADIVAQKDRDNAISKC